MAVHGVKTVSPLISLPHFNLVCSFVPDYVHCILLGVARQFLALWFNSGRPCSISRWQHIVDRRRTSTKPPIDARRMPRNTKERKCWKAKELENWPLCYSVPVLHGILDKAYMQHWACLIKALHIMLQRAISPAKLATVEELLLVPLACRSAVWQVIYEVQYAPTHSHNNNKECVPLGTTQGTQCIHF